MERLTIAEFHLALRKQGVEREHLAFVCPVCKTVQSMASLRLAGAPEDVLENVIGFSCEGRWSNAGPYDTSKTRQVVRGCDWTLGGLFRIHELEVIDEEGAGHPRFIIASAEDAQRLREQVNVAAAGGRHPDQRAQS